MPAPGDSGGQHFVGSRLTVDKAEIGNLQNPAASNIVVTDADQLITGVKATTGGTTSDASGNLPGDTTTALPAGAGIRAGPQWDWGGEKYHARAAGLKGDGTNE